MILASDTGKTVLLTPKCDTLLECVIMCGWIHAYPFHPAKYFSFYCQHHTYLNYCCFIMDITIMYCIFYFHTCKSYCSI